MTRLVHLLLFATWVVGAVTGGLTMQPDAPCSTNEIRVVSATEWTQLTIQADHVVLTLGRGMDRWQAAAPIPRVAHEWLREATDAANEHRMSPPESATFIPLEPPPFS